MNTQYSPNTSKEKETILLTVYQENFVGFRKLTNLCSENGIEDKLLLEINSQEKIEIVCLFEAVIRRDFFGKIKKGTLLAGSVKDTGRRMFIRYSGITDLVTQELICRGASSCPTGL